MHRSFRIRLCRFLVFCMVLACIPLGMPFTAAAYGNGVLLNSGFETYNGASGIDSTLRLTGWKTDSAGARYVNGNPAGTAFARTGNGALKITAKTGNDKTPAMQYVAVVPGQTYHISFYMNVTDCTDSTTRAGMKLRFYPAAYADTFGLPSGAGQIGSDIVAGSVTGTTTTGYQLFEKDFTVPAGANYVRVYLFVGTSAAATNTMFAYVDDISLVQTGGPGPVAVTGISLNKTAATIGLGATEALTATVTPSGAPGSVVWSSSDTGVATVNTNSGLVTGIGPGTAIITATSTTTAPPGHSNVIHTASCFVTIAGTRPDSIAPGLTLTPSFNSCSVYIAGGRSDLIRKLYYRKTGDPDWREALETIYVPAKGIFSGSIVNLEEDTSYEVKSDIFYLDESDLLKSETGSFRTWTSNPAIAQTISLSGIYTGGNALLINGYTGNSTGWIKIVNDTGLTIDAGNTADHAVTVANSAYVLLDGFKVKGGRKNGIQIGSTVADIRIINADISAWGRIPAGNTETDPDGDAGLGCPVDSNGAIIEGDAGIRIDDALNVVVERCYVHEPNGWTNAWTGTTIAGTAYSNSHPYGPEAMFVRSKGGLVVRYNDFCGTDENHRFNDVISGYYNNQESGGFYKDADIYGNFFGYGNDDGVEVDGGQSNIRVYDNRFEMSYAGLSCAPNMVGPSYVFNNVFYNMMDNRRAGTGSVLKMGGNNSTVYKGFTWFFNNTVYAVPKAIVGSSTPSGWYGGTRNNLIVVMRDFAAGTYYNINDNNKLNPAENFDYDALGRSTDADGSGDIYANPGAEAHGLFKIGKVTNPGAGVFTPTASDIDDAKEVSIIDRGTVINNFTGSFSGNAPDIGAFEQGESSLFPKRPMPFRSDQYLVNIPETEHTAAFTISTGTLTGTGDYTIRKSAEEDWYTVTPSSGTFGSNSNVTFNIHVDRTKASFNRTAEYSTLFIRLADGFSIPVTVRAVDAVKTLQTGQTVQLESTKPFDGTAHLHANWVSGSAGVAISAPYTNVPSVSITGVYAGTAAITAYGIENQSKKSEYRVRVLPLLRDLQVDGQTVAGFAPDTYEYDVVLPAGTTAVPDITAAAMDADSASPSAVTYALPSGLPGSAVVTATSSDGTAVGTYRINFIADQAAPVTQALLEGISSENGWYRSDVTAALEVSDDLSGIAFTEYKLTVVQSVYGSVYGTNGFIPYTSPLRLGEGKYSLAYRSADQAGNVEADKTIDIHVDKTAPEATLYLNHEVLTEGKKIEDAQHLVFTLEVSDNLSGIDQREITVDGKSYVEGTPLDLAGKLGIHRVSMVVTDKAGNKAENNLSFEMTTGTASMQKLLDRYAASGDIKQPLLMQLRNDIRQAEFFLKKALEQPLLDKLQEKAGERFDDSRLGDLLIEALQKAENKIEKNSLKMAVKNMEDFIKHLDNKGMEKFISDQAKDALHADAGYLISLWSR